MTLQQYNSISVFKSLQPWHSPSVIHQPTSEQLLASSIYHNGLLSTWQFYGVFRVLAATLGFADTILQDRDAAEVADLIANANSGAVRAFVGGTSTALRAFLQEPSSPSATAVVLPFQSWSTADIEACGIKIDTALVARVVAPFWEWMASGDAVNVKAPHMLNREELWTHPSFAHLQAEYEGKTIDFRHATFIGEIPGFVGVKDLHSSPVKRHLGEERQTSNVTIWTKAIGNRVGIVDGTKISSMKTGYYAAKAMELAFSGESKIRVFVFGTAPVTKAVILALAHAHGDKVERLVVRGTGQSSFALAREIGDQVPFQLLPVLPEEGSSSFLRDAHYIITATNSGPPLFEKDAIAPSAVTLSR